MTQILENISYFFPPVARRNVERLIKISRTPRTHGAFVVCDSRTSTWWFIYLFVITVWGGGRAFLTIYFQFRLTAAFNFLKYREEKCKGVWKRAKSMPLIYEGRTPAGVPARNDLSMSNGHCTSRVGGRELLHAARVTLGSPSLMHSSGRRASAVDGFAPTRACLWVYVSHGIHYRIYLLSRAIATTYVVTLDCPSIPFEEDLPLGPDVRSSIPRQQKTFAFYYDECLWNRWSESRDVNGTSRFMHKMHRLEERVNGPRIERSWDLPLHTRRAALRRYSVTTMIRHFQDMCAQIRFLVRLRCL